MMAICFAAMWWSWIAASVGACVWLFSKATNSEPRDWLGGDCDDD